MFFKSLSRHVTTGWRVSTPEELGMDGHDGSIRQKRARVTSAFTRDTILLYSPNSLAWPVIVFGAAGLKCTFPNSAYTATELAHQYDDGRTKMVMTSQFQYDNINPFQSSEDASFRSSSKPISTAVDPRMSLTLDLPP
ncbi:hypothetical protein K435DRAFT_878604 [Dendrothele bispora CBS 962.96]|uniref:AMP-dependent synthetase/ligase domain-containing protein n=1 Tax=Dendrothele bispora (strain CBS 962.96) TaxID=1314807 RepID=A0A4S8KN00_DENBC|nr:hypothetical protein K435DRAFT_878604 [Dendrothele bispora CBS 962.96]